MCLFLYGWYYPGVRLQVWVCLTCAISPCSNGALQIRVGFELGGVLRGAWPPVLEIGPFSLLLSPFLGDWEGPNSTWEMQKTEETGVFPQISSDLLKTPSLKPGVAPANQTKDRAKTKKS